MDNLRSVLNIVLSKIPTSLIVNSEIQYDNINRDTFVKIAGYYLKYYSNDELDNLFDYIKNEYEDQANYVRGFEIGKYEDKEGFSVFDAILIFATRVLQEIDGEPICRYENVLRWRFTSHLLEEDIFTTAYLAYLENEYALIALALEKAKDENGKNLYNRMFIYQWIENIRKLGLQLSFAKPESSNLEKFIDKIPECVHQ